MRQRLTVLSFGKENERIKKMSLPFIDFKPAQLVETKKETYVAYYAKNPFTDKLERKRIRLNYIQSKQERRKYGQLLAVEINSKLYHGWNPFTEDPKAKKVVTLRKAVDEFLCDKLKTIRNDSARSYKSMSKMLLEWTERNGLDKKPCVSFNNAIAARFMRDMESDKGLSAKTYNNYLRFYSTLFLWFVKKGYAADNPFAAIDRKRVDGKIRDVIPPDVRAKIARYFTDNNMYEYLIVMQLCFRLFIRPKEALMLTIGDVDFANGFLIIPPHVAKNHQERVLAVPDEIMSYLRTLSGMDERMYIFSDNYKPGYVLKTTRDTGRTWSRMREKLKLPASYQFYSLKDTGITEMLEAGVPAKYVKELADHHSLEMTERYTHRSEAKKILEWNNLEF